MNYLKSIIVVSIIFTWSYAFAQSSGKPLSYFFDRHYGQIEVGGRYAGAEFHESRPIPSRISFYSPVANSIDVSTDYWKRGKSLPFALGIRAGREAKRWLGREPWDYTLSPHKVLFHRREAELEYFLSVRILHESTGDGGFFQDQKYFRTKDFGRSVHPSPLQPSDMSDVFAKGFCMDRA